MGLSWLGTDMEVRSRACRMPLLLGGRVSRGGEAGELGLSRRYQSLSPGNVEVVGIWGHTQADSLLCSQVQGVELLST